MRYCRGCGFPAPYGRFLEWTPNGTIIGKDSAHTRLVYLEVDELRSLYDGVAKWIGVTIDPIIYRAEKEVGRRFIKTLLPGIVAKMPRGKFRPQAGIKATSTYVFNYMGGLGMGKGEILEYKSRDSARIRIANSHVPALVVGDGAGVFEYLERVTVDAKWERVRDEEYIVTVQKVSDEPPAEGSEGRLGLSETQYIPGSVSLDTCHNCGVPLDVTNNMYLDLDKGVLRNKQSGIREVALPVQSFDAVFRELTREFGAELPATMEGIEQEYARENSAVRYYAGPRAAADIIHIYSDFPWRGVGNPVYATMTQRGFEVVVDNPFHPGMVAGRVAGVYEAWTGVRVQASWSEDSPGRVRVVLNRAPEQ